MLHTNTIGEGQHFVILHGLFGSGDNWKMIAQHLSQHFQVTLIDLPNHGKSDGLNPCTYENVAQTTISTLDKLGIEKCTLMGHSMGGKIAMTMAQLDAQRFERLIVVDIAPKQYPPHHQTIISALNNMPLESINSRQQANQFLTDNDVEPESTRQFLLRSLYKDENQRFAWRFQLDLLTKQYQHIAAAPKLTPGYEKPVLFLKGGTSNYITAEDQDLILAIYPQAKAKIVAGAGHWLHAEKQRLFIKALEDWLASN